MDNMLGEIKDSMGKGAHVDKYPKVEEIVLGRWEKMNIPIHCLGFALTPRFYDHRYLAMPAPGGTVRKSPNQDKEVIMGVFAKITESTAKAKMLREQFAVFHMRKDLYAMAAAQTDAVTMDAIDWWSTYGSETPELAEVAKKVLSQPISSSSAERNWSTYSFIHSVKRNRLNFARADKLVFIHSNIRLQSRFTETYKDGPFKKWDIDPEHMYVDDSIVRLEELRWKSLDSDYVDALEDDPTEKDDEVTEVPSPHVSMPSGSKRPTPSNPPIRRPVLQQSRISSFTKESTSKDKGKAKQ